MCFGEFLFEFIDLCSKSFYIFVDYLSVLFVGKVRLVITDKFIIDCDFKKVYPGQIIVYIVTPILNIPIKWVTEITHVVDKKYFVDEQRFGPYALWHHKHFIKEIDGGIEMEDVIHYKIPFGPLGVLANYLFVQKKLGSIFVYRRKKLIELFGDLK